MHLVAARSAAHAVLACAPVDDVTAGSSAIANAVMMGTVMDRRFMVHLLV
jgi:hypothetical protein